MTCSFVTWLIHVCANASECVRGTYRCWMRTECEIYICIHICMYMYVMTCPFVTDMTYPCVHQRFWMCERGVASLDEDWVWYDSFVCAWHIHVCTMCFEWARFGANRCVTCWCHTCDITHAWHDAWICVTWLIRMCDMSHWYVWHDSLTCVTWLVDCVTWLSDMCVMRLTHICNQTFFFDLGNVSLACVTWLIHMWKVTYSHVCHAACICVARLIYTCDMPHSYAWHDDAWHDSFDVSRDAFMCVTWRIHTRDVTHSYV